MFRCHSFDIGPMYSKREKVLSRPLEIREGYNILLRCPYQMVGVENPFPPIGSNQRYYTYVYR